MAGGAGIALAPPHLESKMIKAVLPTRGLVYAETMRGLLTNINGEDIIFVIGEQMPDCFNLGIRKALDQGADYIWMVEEDNEIPEGTLSLMLSEMGRGSKIVTLDYPCAGGSHIYYIDDEPVWCGIGCTLIHRSVFEAIQEPWFETKRNMVVRDDGFEIVDIPDEVVDNKWGGHDSLFFYHKARPLGFKIKVLEGRSGKHFRCKEIPKLEKNNGKYTIYSL